MREPLPSTPRNRALRARGGRRVGRARRALGFVGGLVGTRPALIAAPRSPSSPRSVRRAPSACRFRSPAGRCRAAGSTSCRSQSGAPGTAPGSASASSPSSRSRRSGSRAAALALGKPIAAAGCFALYGAGRAFMTSGRGGGSRAGRPPSRSSSAAPRSWPRERGRPASRSSSSPSRRRPAPPSPRSAAASTRRRTGRRSPARMDRDDQGRRRRRPRPDRHGQPGECACARRRLPRLRGRPGHQGDRLAQRHARRQLDGPYSHPALDWPLLAYIRDDGAYERLILADITKRIPTSGKSPRCARRPISPAGAARRTARVAPIVHGGSAINVLNLATNERSAIKDEHLDGGEPVGDLEAHRLGRAPPAGSYLRMKWFGSKRTKTLMHVSGGRPFSGRRR